MLKKVLSAVVGIVLALVLLEAGMRTVGWGLLAEQEYNNEIRAEDARSIRIVALGESTTADFDRKDESWPRQLEEKLLKRGVKARVYNLGRPNTTTTAILERLPEQLEKFRPHIVISMMGINDSKRFIPQSSGRELRIVKLYDWLFTTPKKVSNEIEPKNFTDAKTASKILRGLQASDPTSAVAQIEGYSEKLNANEKAQFYLYFANQLYDTAWETNKKIIVELGRRSLLARFRGGITLHGVIRGLTKLERDQDCLEFAKKYLDQDWEMEEETLGEFAACSQVSMQKDTPAKKEWPGILKKMKAAEVYVFGNNELTGKNHQTLHQLVSEKKVLHIEMQYPTLSIDLLKNYFAGSESSQTFADIVFVENKTNFEKALKKLRREDIFEDNFAGTFGHSTRLGNNLIAENVAATVLKLTSTPDFDPKGN
jgi:lysophospholipase L1-like esterase